MVLPAAAKYRASTVVLRRRRPWDAPPENPLEGSTKVSDNFDAMIEALKQTGKRLRQALEEIEASAVWFRRG